MNTQNNCLGYILACYYDDRIGRWIAVMSGNLTVQYEDGREETFENGLMFID